MAEGHRKDEWADLVFERQRPFAKLIGMSSLLGSISLEAERKAEAYLASLPRYAEKHGEAYAELKARLRRGGR